MCENPVPLLQPMYYWIAEGEVDDTIAFARHQIMNVSTRFSETRFGEPVLRPKRESFARYHICM